MQTPHGCIPPGCPLLYTDPLPIGCKPPTLDADPPWMQIPSRHVTSDARWEASPPPSPVDRRNHTRL